MSEEPDVDHKKAAREKLNRAVHEYYRDMNPDIFVHDWVLVTDTDQKEKPDESEFSIRIPEYKDYVSIVNSSDSRWSTIVGLLRIALRYKETH